MPLEDYANPHFLREQLFALAQRMTLREEHDERQDQRLERHEELLSILTTIVRGNAEIQHGGILAQMAELNKTIAEMRHIQEQAERERNEAKQRAERERELAAERAEGDRKAKLARYAGVGLGISIAAVPGIEKVVEMIKAAF